MFLKLGSKILDGEFSIGFLCQQLSMLAFKFTHGRDKTFDLILVGFLIILNTLLQLFQLVLLLIADSFHLILVTEFSLKLLVSLLLLSNLGVLLIQILLEFVRLNIVFKEKVPFLSVL